MKKPPLEKYTVKKILDHIKSRGGFALKIHGSMFMMIGIPDIIACYRGHFLAFEVKRSADETLKPSQKYWLKRIRAAGGTAARTHTVEKVSLILDRIERLEGGQEQPPDH